MELIDAHTHITFDDVKDYLEDVRRAKNAGVKRAMLVATEEKEVEQFKELKNLDFFDMGYGLFPGDVDINYKERLKKIQKSHESFNFKAFGEIGLDYHYEGVDKDLQKEAFIAQIKMANELKKPVFIHTRDASLDTLNILKAYRPKYGCMMHCFSESKELAKEYVKLGFYISFSGTITFKNNRRAKESVLEVPLDRLLIETDAPYLAPTPKRGQRNEMAYIAYTYQAIALELGIDLETLAKCVKENYERLYQN